MVSFKATTKESNLIDAIVDRALPLIPKSMRYKRFELIMDLTAVNANGNPLRLEELLNADGFNFSHDIFGIIRHIDRSTGKLTDCFVPRFTRSEAA